MAFSVYNPTRQRGDLLLAGSRNPTLTRGAVDGRIQRVGLLLALAGSSNPTLTRGAVDGRIRRGDLLLAGSCNPTLTRSF